MPIPRDTARAISQENVELVRGGIDAFNRRDVDAFVALLAPDVVWEENPELPGLRDVYRGRAEVREWFKEALLEPWESFHVAIEEITELSGDLVFTETVLTARGTGSGAPVELRFWSVLWVAESKLARRQVFWTRDDALKAAGLSE